MFTAGWCAWARSCWPKQSVRHEDSGDLMPKRLRSPGRVLCPLEVAIILGTLPVRMTQRPTLERLSNQDGWLPTADSLRGPSAPLFDGGRHLHTALSYSTAVSWRFP